MSNITNDKIIESVREKEYDITLLIGEDRISLHGTIDDAIAQLGSYERNEARRASVYIPPEELFLDNEDGEQN